MNQKGIKSTLLETQQRVESEICALERDQGQIATAIEMADYRGDSQQAENMAQEYEATVEQLNALCALSDAIVAYLSKGRV